MTMGRHWGSLASAGAVGTDWPPYTADSKKVRHALYRTRSHWKSCLTGRHTPWTARRCATVPRSVSHMPVLDAVRSAVGGWGQVMIFDTPATSVGTEADVDDGSAAVHCEHWREYM